MKTEIENILLSIALKLTRAQSDWNEAQSILDKAQDGKRKANKTEVGSSRVAPHGVDTSTESGKKKAKAFQAAAKDLNAADLLGLGSEERAILEAFRLEVKAASEAKAKK